MIYHVFVCLCRNSIGFWCLVIQVTSFSHDLSIFTKNKKPIRTSIKNSQSWETTTQIFKLETHLLRKDKFLSLESSIESRNLLEKKIKKIL